jgi:hypothetical protein
MRYPNISFVLAAVKAVAVLAHVDSDPVYQALCDHPGSAKTFCGPFLGVSQVTAYVTETVTR